jgi:multiple sugar transport system permease protein/putative aldouronate transport system permease protein
MGDLLFLNSFMISVIRTVLGTLFTLFTIILMAYPLSKSKKEYTHRNKFMWLIIFCMLFSGGIVPWYITMLRYNLIDNIFGLVLAGGLPIFSMLLVMNYFRNLPREMEESAIIDGANPWIILFKVIVPVSVPVIATVALFSGVGYWNEWFQGLLLSSGQEHYPLQTYIQQLVVPVPQSVTDVETLMRLAKLSNRALDAAKVFIAMIPLLCVYPFLQRYFITGITLGSVKE